MPRIAATVVVSTLGLALLPATAMAQAPGECSSCAVPAATATAIPDDMAHRFGVGAHMVSLSLDDHSGADPTEYGGGGLVLSYRISPRWEIAMALDALDAPSGPDLHSVLLSARFHMMPHARWDWYLLAGIGGIGEAPLEGETQTNDNGRGQFHFGAGVERRFTRWSISAELHAVGVGPVENSDAMPPPIERPASTTTMESDGKLSGGELTLAAMFYF